MRNPVLNKMRPDLFVISIILYISFNVSFAEDEENGGAKKISLSVPKLSEEETQSNHMPHHLRCDACLAVAFQMENEFIKHQKKKTNLKEYDILDILEEICNKGFNDYGVKQVDGINRLSGPGLETEHVMGMTQMGGRWPHRLQEMCHYYVGEAGEMDIYKKFTDGELTKFLCYGKGIYSHCTQAKASLKNEL